MEQKTYASPRGDIAYWITRNANPDAPCIFFLHGLTVDHTLFDPQMQHFAARYTVIAWDAPGHALSRPYRDFSYANCADDMRNILQGEDISRAVFVGQSMGGYIVQAFLLRYPDLALAFVGVDTCPFGLSYYSRSDIFWLRQVGWMSRLYPHAYFVNTVVNSVALTDQGRTNMRNALSYYSHKELCELMDDGYKSFVNENRDLSIPCPVLIIAGAHDNTGKVLSYSNAWHAKTGYPLRLFQTRHITPTRIIRRGERSNRTFSGRRNRIIFFVIPGHTIPI